MSAPSARPNLPWLAPGDPFPNPVQAWGPGDPAPGLLAAGGSLDVITMQDAYSQGIFPWFSDGQPILWWSPDPRMVLQVAEFRLHRSLRKTLAKFQATPGCEVRFDTAFASVVQACARAPRPGQSGTWIVKPMATAYESLHRAGLAHSVETWVDGQLCGGLYCVALGHAVFGESMFALRPDASKIALAALVAFCRQHGMDWIDCQQNTRHLASMGAREFSRREVSRWLRQDVSQPSPHWQFDPVYWNALAPHSETTP
ncbi:MAG: leucyl/phenylalanyl-tRNA--protein transferase [Burkholderiales bacterium]|nr:leucyl/phenylalanyl-tRNA--protein transferase [Burkholderiales bacterium]